MAAFRGRMEELGYADSDLQLIVRLVPGLDAVPGAVKELKDEGVEVIVGLGTVIPANQYIGTTPFVMAVGGDPVEAGVVQSLSRPGGMITGVASNTSGLMVKRIELLKEIAPSIAHVGLMDRAGREEFSTRTLARVREAVAGLGVTVAALEVSRIEDLDDGLARAIAGGMDGFVAHPLAFLSGNPERTVELAAKHHLPAVFAVRALVEAGALASLGDDVVEQVRRSAGYVEKILKGAKPGELPIDVPEKFDLALNLRAAVRFGLAIPQSALIRANEVIR